VRIRPAITERLRMILAMIHFVCFEADVQDARFDWNQFLEEFERQKMSQEEMQPMIL
jgi:hypothetical protein